MSNKTLVFLIVIISFCMDANSQHMQRIIYNEKHKEDALVIHEGILCQHATQIKYKRGGKKVAAIELSEPVMIVMAEQEEKWGFYQFPFFGRSHDGTLIVSWQMSVDVYTSYGKKSKFEKYSK